MENKCTHHFSCSTQPSSSYHLSSAYSVWTNLHPYIVANTRDAQLMMSLSENWWKKITSEHKVNTWMMSVSFHHGHAFWGLHEDSLGWQSMTTMFWTNLASLDVNIRIANSDIEVFNQYVLDGLKETWMWYWQMQNAGMPLRCVPHG